MEFPMTISNPSDWLQHNETEERLEEIYGDQDYYWYLRSVEFHEAFLLPMAVIINQLGERCLDVGCGQGWLEDHLNVPYVGIDGSISAIQRARETHRHQPLGRFEVARIEEPRKDLGEFGTLVLGGILDVLILKRYYVDLVELYRALYSVNYLIVYDLQRLDTNSLDRTYSKVSELQGTAQVPGLQEVKKHRKIILYRIDS